MTVIEFLHKWSSEVDVGILWLKCIFIHGSLSLFQNTLVLGQYGSEVENTDVQYIEELKHG